MNTLNIGERITLLRKKKKLSQADLASVIGASRDMIGKYERNDNLPSVEVAFKLAEVFEVTIDYLLGKGQYATFDKESLERLEDIENLDSNTRKILFEVIDTFIRDAKARKAYS